MTMSASQGQVGDRLLDALLATVSLEVYIDVLSIDAKSRPLLLAVASQDVQGSGSPTISLTQF